MMLAAEGPSALPLWINGHAFLTITDQFQVISNPSTGQALRQVPLCGRDEVELAQTSANTVSQAWQDIAPDERRDFLTTTAELLFKYSGHFAKLISEESGIELSLAETEVSQAIEALKAPSSEALPTAVTAILVDASAPFAEPIKAIAGSLASGNTVVLKTSIKVPSPMYAFAELTARANLPAGVFNLIHGDEAAIDAIANSSVLNRIVFTGNDELGQKIQNKLNPQHKTLIRVNPN